MRVAWLTDVHLNFVPRDLIALLGRECRARAEAILISGDIAEAKSVERCLRMLQEAAGIPVYYVLGNHDFYGANQAIVEDDMTALSKEKEFFYLSTSGVIELTPKLALVGEDGWYDGRNGTFETSLMELRDFTEVANIASAFRAAGKMGLKFRLRELADRAVARFAPKLEEALAKYEHVLFVTHVPPFPGACWHKGKPSDAYALPYFSSKATGDKLVELADKYPETKLTVLCGHTHSYGEYRPLENIEVFTGSAEYYEPTIMRIIEVEGASLTMHRMT